MTNLSEYLQSKRKLCADLVESQKGDLKTFAEYSQYEAAKFRFDEDSRTTMPKLLEALERAVEGLNYFKTFARNDVSEHLAKTNADIERILEVKP